MYNAVTGACTSVNFNTFSVTCIYWPRWSPSMPAKYSRIVFTFNPNFVSSGACTSLAIITGKCRRYVNVALFNQRLLACIRLPTTAVRKLRKLEKKGELPDDLGPALAAFGACCVTLHCSLSPDAVCCYVRGNMRTIPSSLIMWKECCYSNTVLRIKD